MPPRPNERVLLRISRRHPCSTATELHGQASLCFHPQWSPIVLKLPPPVWALVYLLVALGISRGIGASPLPIVPGVLFGIVLTGAGFAVSVSAAICFRREDTELNPTSISNRKLVTSGPFGFTRNPMYLGLVLITLGVALWIGTWPMLLAPIAMFATANWVHIPFEEAKMHRQFGAAFQTYTDRVRRWI
jgi:protein-S-isoprenylcysteine O-methyltransferase Ste14